MFDTAAPGDRGQGRSTGRAHDSGAAEAPTTTKRQSGTWAWRAIHQAEPRFRSDMRPSGPLGVPLPGCQSSDVLGGTAMPTARLLQHMLSVTQPTPRRAALVNGPPDLERSGHVHRWRRTTPTGILRRSWRYAVSNGVRRLAVHVAIYSSATGGMPSCPHPLRARQDPTLTSPLILAH